MDRYDKIRTLGRGAFATVHHVRHRETGENLVVKVFHTPMEELGQREREEILQEIKLLAHLRHDGVVRFVDNFVEEGTMHIVMEYASAGTLQRRLQEAEGEYFDEQQLWEWFVQIVDALRYVHSRSILHRDLKPANIMLAGAQGRTIKLGDFGIAKILGKEERAATIVGTPHYLSPEATVESVSVRGGPTPRSARDAGSLVATPRGRRILPPEHESLLKQLAAVTAEASTAGTSANGNRNNPETAAAVEKAIHDAQHGFARSGSRTGRTARGEVEEASFPLTSARTDRHTARTDNSATGLGSSAGGHNGSAVGAGPVAVAVVDDDVCRSSVSRHVDSDFEGGFASGPVAVEDAEAEAGISGSDPHDRHRHLDGGLRDGPVDGHGDDDDDDDDEEEAPAPIEVRVGRIHGRMLATGAAANGVLWESLGRAWAELGHFDRAIAAYRMSLKRSGSRASVGAMEQLGNLLVRRAQQVWSLARLGDVDQAASLMVAAGSKRLRRAVRSFVRRQGNQDVNVSKGNFNFTVNSYWR
ncbi:hypothetical protein FNF29_06912 [Cafeteria roenbergensis]|uniref:non-specific serine/threonine protein kinase n=1 Tax=Cafeteria roenbergensis TaxID=33653 RepID=A0A5A8C634_CAFRO|nr:hypothetical protein FNF29_06912 [Cafeteria roenbergensis]|eukprot:KAA0148117.1 hypothetical protein FNF29_06912 [Cafeteria roenbergensis]